MRDNEFSCYFLNSSGQHIIHGSIYIVFKGLLIFLIHCLCQRRIKNVEMEMHLERLKQESKQQAREQSKLEKESRPKKQKSKLKKKQKSKAAHPKPEEDGRGEKMSAEDQQREKLTMSYRFTRLMFKLNLRVNFKFFFTVLSMFQVEFLLSAFANFRFLKANSTFGVISLALSVLIIALILFVIGISAWKMHLIKTVKQESYELKLKTYDKTKETISVRKDLQQTMRKLPCVRIPPRGLLASNTTRRRLSPSTPSTP